MDQNTRIALPLVPSQRLGIVIVYELEKQDLVVYILDIQYVAAKLHVSTCGLVKYTSVVCFQYQQSARNHVVGSLLRFSILV